MLVHYWYTDWKALYTDLVDAGHNMRCDQLNKIRQFGYVGSSKGQAGEELSLLLSEAGCGEISGTEVQGYLLLKIKKMRMR